MPVWQPITGWFEQAVTSALDQEGCALELIVVDDGNDPPVSHLLTGLADPRLTVVRVAHGGVCHARNAGTRAARAAFLRYVDADDVLEPRSTRRLLDLAAPDRISYEDTMVCDEELHPVRRISSRASGWIAEQCLLGQYDTRIVSMLFPRDVVERAGPWDPRLSVREDFEFVLRCLELAPVVPGEGVATFYRRHGASATRSRDSMARAEFASRQILAGYLHRNPQARGSALHRQAATQLHASEAEHALDTGALSRAALRALPLLRVAPRRAVVLWLRVVKRLTGRLLRARAPAG